MHMKSAFRSSYVYSTEILTGFPTKANCPPKIFYCHAGIT